MGAKRGDIWIADLGLAAKSRPVVIVSRDDTEAPRALFTYVPLTTQSRGSAYEVEMPKLAFLREISWVNIQGIGSLVEARLERRLGIAPAETMDRITQALIFALALESPQGPDLRAK